MSREIRQALNSAQALIMHARNIQQTLDLSGLEEEKKAMVIDWLDTLVSDTSRIYEGLEVIRSRLQENE